jgi:hypothetical protein
VDYFTTALHILERLAFSARPLWIGEIVEIIAVDIGDDPRFTAENQLKVPRFNAENQLIDPRDILKICSSLVAMTTDETKGPNSERTNGQIMLAHFSVKEYLVSDRIIKNGPAQKYAIKKERANTSIAETCLAYLLHFDQDNFWRSQTFEEFPLALYSARYWTKHAREDAEAMHELVMELFLSKTDAFVNWLHLFNLDRPVYESLPGWCHLSTVLPVTTWFS